MNIAVRGVGAMGCLFAGRLAAHARVCLLGHWPEQLAVLRRRGLTVLGPGNEETRLDLPVVEDPAQMGPVELVLVLVKSHQTAAAALESGRLLEATGTDSGLVLTLQNGAGNREKIAAEVGPDRAALGITAQGATLLAPGTVRHAGQGLTELVAEPGLGSRLAPVVDLFRRCGFPTRMVADGDGLLWGKLAVNATINPVSALLRVKNGFLARQAKARRLMARAANEVAAVARAQGIRLPFPDPLGRVLEVCRATAENRSSMLQDLERERPTEIDSICGVVVEEGRRSGVPVPVNELFLRLVQQAESAGSSRGTGAPHRGRPALDLDGLCAAVAVEAAEGRDGSKRSGPP